MAVGAEHRSKFPALYRYGDVSIWVNILKWDEKKTTNQTNYTNKGNRGHEKINELNENKLFCYIYPFVLN